MVKKKGVVTRKGRRGHALGIGLSKGAVAGVDKRVTKFR